MWRVPRAGCHYLPHHNQLHTVLCCPLRGASGYDYYYRSNGAAATTAAAANDHGSDVSPLLSRQTYTTSSSLPPAPAAAATQRPAVLRRFASAEDATPYTKNNNDDGDDAALSASHTGTSPPHTTTHTSSVPYSTSDQEQLSSRCFWAHPVQAVPAADLKRRYGYERALDKKSRFLVRGRLRRDGVISNFFPVYFPEKGPLAREQCPVYIYQLYATRKRPSRGLARRRGGGDEAGGKAEEEEGKGGKGEKVPIERVKPSAAWRALWRHLNKCFVVVPPLVVVMDKVYTNAPLPGHFLKVPREFHDLGWTACELRFIGRYTFADLTPLELQEVTNKIAMWVIGQRANTADKARGAAAGHGMMIVRDRTGKVVNAQSGISADGVRIYRGVTIRAIYLDADTAEESNTSSRTIAQVSSSSSFSAAATASPYGSNTSGNNSSNSNNTPLQGVATRELAEAQPGLSSPEHPLHFCVETMTRAFEFRGRKVESYKIRDASGIYLASYWEPPTSHALRDGACYAARAVQVSDFPERNNLRLFEFKPNVTQIVPVPRDEPRSAPDAPSSSSNSSSASPAPTTSPPQTREEANAEDDAATARQRTMMPGRLTLKIDTKGTVAAETSLWEEVKQHFGPGPYDTETQGRIVAAVEATPVVISYSLRQSVVRQVRFRIQFLPGETTGEAAAATAAALPSTALTINATVHSEAQTSTQRSLRDPKYIAGAAHIQKEYEAEGGESDPAAMLLRVRHSRMEPELLTLMPYLDPHQPYAVLMDYTVLPLQVLHCCFDPRMRSWQDVTGATLAHLPRRRMDVLQEFRTALEAGMREWGLQLAAEACRTTHLSLLPLPTKVRGPPAAAIAVAAGRPRGAASSPLVYGTAIDAASLQNNYTSSSNGNSTLRHPAPPPFPTTILIVGVLGSSNTMKEGERSSGQRRVAETVAQLGRYFATTLVQCVKEEAEVVRYMTEHVLVHPSAAASHGQPIRDPNTALLLVTAQRESRATRWVMVECLSRGVLPVVLPPCGSTRRALILCGNLKAQLVVKFETDPFRGVNLQREVPATAGRRLLLVGVDTCHTKSISVGSVVGLVVAPQRHHVLPIFWTHSIRGREVQQVSHHFRSILAEAVTLYDGLDEVVILQDGDVFSELSGMKAEIQATVPHCGLTFMCLHKRTNVRFLHDARATAAVAPRSDLSRPVSSFNNVVKGTVIPALTPVALDYEPAAPSFYLQTHETSLSTARIVQYTVHHVSPTFDVTDVCQLANVMANVLAPQATKLPMPTRCAHRLADYAERLIDAVPQFQHHYIPQPLRQRLWYL